MRHTENGWCAPILCDTLQECIFVLISVFARHPPAQPNRNTELKKKEIRAPTQSRLTRFVRVNRRWANHFRLTAFLAAYRMQTKCVIMTTGKRRCERYLFIAVAGRDDCREKKKKLRNDGVHIFSKRQNELSTHRRSSHDSLCVCASTSNEHFQLTSHWIFPLLLLFRMLTICFVINRSAAVHAKEHTKKILEQICKWYQRHSRWHRRRRGM